MFILNQAIRRQLAKAGVEWQDLRWTVELPPQAAVDAGSSVRIPVTVRVPRLATTGAVAGASGLLRDPIANPTVEILMYMGVLWWATHRADRCSPWCFACLTPRARRTGPCCASSAQNKAFAFTCNRVAWIP